MLKWIFFFSFFHLLACCIFFFICVISILYCNLKVIWIHLIYSNIYSYIIDLNLNVIRIIHLIWIWSERIQVEFKFRLHSVTILAIRIQFYPSLYMLVSETRIWRRIIEYKRALLAILLLTCLLSLYSFNFAILLYYLYE